MCRPGYVTLGVLSVCFGGVDVSIGLAGTLPYQVYATISKIRPPRQRGMVNIRRWLCQSARRDRRWTDTGRARQKIDRANRHAGRYIRWQGGMTARQWTGTRSKSSTSTMPASQPMNPGPSRRPPTPASAHLAAHSLNRRVTRSPCCQFSEGGTQRPILTCTMGTTVTPA